MAKPDIHDEFESLPDKQPNRDLQSEFESLPDQPSSPLGEPLQNIVDLGLGVAQGVTLGGADELTAGARALINAPSSEKSLADLYSEYKAIEDQRLKEAQERSPVLTTAGDVAGSILPAFLTGGTGVAARAGLGLGKAVALREAGKMGVKELGKELGKRAATTGLVTGAASGLEGALRSEEGKLINATPEEQEKLLGEAKASASLGGLLDTVMGGGAKSAKDFASRAFKAAEEGSDTIKLGTKAYELAKEGVPLVSRKAREEAKVGLRSLSMAEDLTDRIIQADKELGKEVGESIRQATERGITTSVSQIPEELRPLIPGYRGISLDDFESMDPKQAMTVMDQAIENKRLLEASTPVELKNTIQNLDQEIEYLVGNPQEKRRLSEYIKLREDLSNQLKGLDESIGESYGKFRKYRQTIPEKIINEGLEAERTGRYFGDIQNKKGKLDKEFLNLLHSDTKAGKPAEERAKQSLLQSIEQLEKENPEILEKMGISSSADFKKQFREMGAETGAIELGAGTPYQGQSVPIHLLKQSVPFTKEGAIVYGAAAGNIARSRPVKFGKEMYNLDNTAYQQIGDMLMQSNNKTLQAIGDSLKTSIEMQDSAKRNAAIFSILQNPEARKIFSSEEEK